MCERAAAWFLICRCVFFWVIGGCVLPWCWRRYPGGVWNLQIATLGDDPSDADPIRAAVSALFTLPPPVTLSNPSLHCTSHTERRLQRVPPAAVKCRVGTLPHQTPQPLPRQSRACPIPATIGWLCRRYTGRAACWPPVSYLLVRGTRGFLFLVRPRPAPPTCVCAHTCCLRSLRRQSKCSQTQSSTGTAPKYTRPRLLFLHLQNVC